jgi:hypothetical protein
VTTPPLIEHTVALDESTVIVTGNPEVALALGIYPTPPTAAAPGALLVKLMLCEPLPTLNDCCTCGAGAYMLFPD